MAESISSPAREHPLFRSADLYAGRLKVIQDDNAAMLTIYIDFRKGTQCELIPLVANGSISFWNQRRWQGRISRNDAESAGLHLRSPELRLINYGEFNLYRKVGLPAEIDAYLRGISGKQSGQIELSEIKIVFASRLELKNTAALRLWDSITSRKDASRLAVNRVHAVHAREATLASFQVGSP